MFEANKNSIQNLDFEAKHNLVGFFDLLFKIDKRVNPHLYENNRNTNNADQGE